MKLIYIYGMPAVGKLSVAIQLEKMTGFKLFHNHLTSDFVSSLFPERNEMTNNLKCEIALKMFKAAAEHNLNQIFTMAHEEVHNDFLKSIIDTVEKSNGEVLFVKLICQKEKLYERVTADSRKQYGKAKTTEAIDEVLRRSNEFVTIPFKESLTIDNTNLSPEKCAQQIKEHYKL